MFSLERASSTIYESKNFLVLDFETTGIDKGSPLTPSNTIVLACWHYKGKYKYQWGGEFDMSSLLEDINRADFIVAHNAKFELGWLRRCGLDLRTVLIWDTMLADKVIAGNRTWKLGLNDCLERRGLGAKDNLVNILIKGGVSCVDIPRELLLRYCTIDVRQTGRLFTRQRGEMSQGLKNVQLSRCLLTPVLADVEFSGMQLDAPEVEKVYTEESVNLALVQQEFFTLAKDINPNSPKQMSGFLYDQLGFQEIKDKKGNPITTKAGARCTDAPTVARLKPTTKEQKEFLEIFKNLKKLDTKVNKYLKKFKQVCAEDRGILHATFNQTITQTHRLSSSGGKHKVQLQNIDRNYKKLFTPRHKGWFMGSADYSQLEFRVAVFLGQDPQGMKDIDNKEDVHQYTADVLTAAGEPTTRQDAKKSTFKPLYGGTSGTKAEQAYYKAFREKYKDITATQQEWVRKVVEDKQLETITGLVFYWPDTQVTSSGYVINNENIHNYPVQSLATADVGPLGIVNLWHSMAGMKSFLINTVHDSVVAEVHPDEVEEFKTKVQNNMTEGVYHALSKVYNINFNVTLNVDITISNSWSG